MTFGSIVGTRPKWHNGAWWGYCVCGNAVLGRVGERKFRHAERDAGLPDCNYAHPSKEDRAEFKRLGWPNAPSCPVGRDA